MAALAEPVYDSAEHYNQEELVAQVKRMKAEFKVVREATVEVLEKHNNVVDDVKEGFNGLMACVLARGLPGGSPTPWVLRGVRDRAPPASEHGA